MLTNLNIGDESLKIILLMMTLVSSIVCAKISIGTNFPKVFMVDQFGETLDVQRKGTTKVIISFEKEVSTSINHFLQKQKKTFLTDNNITYISDISRAPSFIISWLVLPKIKKLSFPIALIYDTPTADKFRHKKGKATVYTLKDDSIIKIEFINPKILDKFFGKIKIDKRKTIEKNSN